MTQADFLPLLESQLALYGVALDRAELIEWVASMWAWIQDEPDAGRWAAEFIEARTVPWSG